MPDRCEQQGFHGATATCTCSTDLHSRCLLCGEDHVSILISINGSYLGCNGGPA